MSQVQVMAAAGAVLLAAAAPVWAEIYKSFDADGNVVYSASPYTGGDPDRAQSVQIAPGPTDEDRAAAERRQQALQPPTGGAAGLPGGTPPPQQVPPAATPKQAEPSNQGIDSQVDEAVRRARTTGREHRSTGGFAGDKRNRSSATLPSERTSR